MAIPSKLVIDLKNDQYIELSAVANGLTAEYINDAIATVTLYDRDGSVVPDVSALPLDYVAESDGVYRGLIPNTFNPARGGGYKLMVDVVSGEYKAHIEIPVEVKVRVA